MKPAAPFAIIPAAIIGCGLATAVRPDGTSPVGSSTHRDAPALDATRRLFVVTAWVDCATQQPDLKLASLVQDEAKGLIETIESAAADVRADKRLGANPSKGDLLRVLESTRSPLWFIYSGHARVENGQSVICLPDGNLAIDKIVAAPPPGTAASFWFNGCQTANVDVTRAETSAFAASPDEVATDLRATITGGAIIEAVRDPPDATLPTDANCDGLITDEELFHAVRHNLPPYGDKPVKPKLRRQAWAEIPLYHVRERRFGCNTFVATGPGRTAGRTPLPPPVLDSGPGGEGRLRYTRPLVASEHDTLIREGYRACPCDEWTGHCYCRTASALPESAP